MTYLFEDLEKLRNEYQLNGDLSFSETYIRVLDYSAHKSRLN